MRLKYRGHIHCTKLHNTAHCTCIPHSHTERALLRLYAFAVFLFSAGQKALLEERLHSIRFLCNKNSFCEFYLNSNKFESIRFGSIYHIQLCVVVVIGRVRGGYSFFFFFLFRRHSKCISYFIYWNFSIFNDLQSITSVIREFMRSLL